MLPVIALLLIVAVSPGWAEDTDHVTKIMDLTFLPSGPLAVGTKVAAIVRVYTTYGALNPIRWTINGVVRNVLYEDFKALENRNEYEISAWLGSMPFPAFISVEINNMHGSDRKTGQILTAMKFGEMCNSTAVCMTNNTECSTLGLCLCRTGYNWDSSEYRCRQTGMFGSDCETSEPCREVTNNSECNPVKGKCFCIPGYGYDKDYFAPDCKRYPLYTVYSVPFGGTAILNCTAHLSNVTEIQWFRNGRDLCTSETPWCRQNKTTSREEENNYFSQMIVNSVTSNANYTCVAFDSEGRNWTVSNQKLVVAGSQNSTDRPTYETSEVTTDNTTLPTSEVTSIGTPTPEPPSGVPALQGGNVFIKHSNIYNLFIFPLKKQK